MRIAVKWSNRSKRMRWVEGLYADCVSREIPAILLSASVDRDLQPGEALARLAAVASFDRVQLEAGVLLIDGLDRVDTDSGLYRGILPFLEGRRVAYGKFGDLADLGKVDIVAAVSAPKGQAIGFRSADDSATALPGLAGRVLRMVDGDSRIVWREVPK